MAISQFTPRAMTASVRMMGDGRQNFLTNSVFERGGMHPTESINFGVMKVLARALVYQKLGGPAVPVNKSAADANSVTAPRLRLKTVMDEGFALILNPALASYVGPYTDPQAQMAEKVAMEQRKLRMRVDRAIELQAAEGLSTGIVTIPYEDGSSATVVYGYTGNGVLVGDGYTIQPTLAGTNVWSSVQSKPMDVLEALASQIRDGSDYGGAFDVLLGADAWAALMNNDKAMKQLDNRNLNIGQMAPVAAALFKGMFNGMQIFQYSIGYHNVAGARVQAFNSKLAVVVPRQGTGLLTVEHAAVFEQATPEASASFIQTDYFSKTVHHEDPPVDEIIVESRPLALVKDPSAIRVQQVLA